MAAEPRWLDEVELDAWRTMIIMQGQLTALLGHELAADGLSFQDYLVLAHLSDCQEGRSRLNEVGHRLGWEKSRVSHHLTRMQSRGLVDRVRCPTDRRGWFVELTDEGRAAIAAAAPDHVETVRRYFFDLLTRDEVETLGHIARTVLDHLPGNALGSDVDDCE